MDEAGSQAPVSEVKRGEHPAQAAGKAPGWRRLPVILTGSLILYGLAFVGLRYLAESLTHESTDDAFLDANIVAIAPKVAGQVNLVQVASNQKVQTGDPLLEIDPRDLAVQLEQKRAAVDSARANVELLQASLELLRTQIATAEATAKQTAAEATASEANSDKAQADLKRAEQLRKQQTISPQEFDAARTAALAAEANLSAAREKASSDQSKVAQSRAQFEAGRKAYDRALAQTRQAELEAKAAELDLSYVRVVAPMAGYVTRKAVESGDYVQVGQKLMALVPLDLFVTANFKETQLRRIRTNQPVKIRIDSVAGRTFPGHVQSIQAGTGARFSLLPPENAVGSYIKVVQRVPVKIVFDHPAATGYVLGPGMSVVPAVQVVGYQIAEGVVAAAAALLALVTGAIWWWLARRGRKSGPSSAR